MSKSKRMAQGASTPAPRPDRRVLTNSDGKLRTGWLLAVSLLCYAALAFGLRYGLGRAFAGLFGAWGIDPTNVHRAPGWAQAVYRWHGAVVSAVISLLTLALCRFLRKSWLPGEGAVKFQGRAMLAFAGAGFAVAALVAALSLIPDSSRMAWPFTRPRLTWGMPVLCAVSFLTALAEEMFGKAVLYDGIRARHGRIWATVAACVFFTAVNVTIVNAIGIVNMALLSLVLCLLHERRGLWAAVGVRWGWAVTCAVLLGFGGADSAVYRLYGVSEMLMTGGDAGPVYGLWMTLLLAGMIALFLFNQKQTD